LIVAASCLQWIVAPWLAAQYPSGMVRIRDPPIDSLGYAVPATIALGRSSSARQPDHVDDVGAA
jgi:hypothetical protein